jgi:hypothetical protein
VLIALSNTSNTIIATTSILHQPIPSIIIMKLKCSTDSPHKRRLSFESKCLIFLLFSVLIIGAALLSDYDTLFPKESDLTTKSDGKIYWRDDGVAKCSVCRERMRTCNTVRTDS